MAPRPGVAPRWATRRWISCPASKALSCSTDSTGIRGRCSRATRPTRRPCCASTPTTSARPRLPITSCAASIQVDGRLGAMEDSLALREILRRYYPVMTEKAIRAVPARPAGRGDAASRARGGLPAHGALRRGGEPGGCARRVLNCCRCTSRRRSADTSGGHASSATGCSWTCGRRRGRRSTAGWCPRWRRKGSSSTHWWTPRPISSACTAPSSGDRVVSFRVTPASSDFKDEIEMTVSVVPRLPCRTLDAATVDAPACAEESGRYHVRAGADAGEG